MKLLSIILDEAKTRLERTVEQWVRYDRTSQVLSIAPDLVRRGIKAALRDVKEMQSHRVVATGDRLELHATLTNGMSFTVDIMPEQLEITPGSQSELPGAGATLIVRGKIPGGIRPDHQDMVAGFLLRTVGAMLGLLGLAEKKLNSVKGFAVEGEDFSFGKEFDHLEEVMRILGTTLTEKKTMALYFANSWLCLDLSPFERIRIQPTEIARVLAQLVVNAV
jgi:hypothetical protein